MKSISGWVLGRLTEPATWAGAALIAATLQHALATGDWKSIAASAFGAMAVLLKEKGAVS